VVVADSAGRGQYRDSSLGHWVGLNENVKVKQETLAAARQLYQDDEIQVEVGTLAPLELNAAGLGQSR